MCDCHLQLKATYLLTYLNTECNAIVIFIGGLHLGGGGKSTSEGASRIKAKDAEGDGMWEGGVPDIFNAEMAYFRGIFCAKLFFL